VTITIIYYTRFGNNAIIAERLSDTMESRGHGVSIHPINEASPSEIPASDLYIVGSPTQIGSAPIKVSRFLKRLKVKPESQFAIYTTYAESNSEAAAKIATAMESLGAVSTAEPLLIGVKDLRGPLEDEWESKLSQWAENL
jgi:menaquinone-dependent protoporphyrinogen IX oxidase